MEKIKILSNGAHYDTEKGRIVANPGGGTHAITAENSSAYHARRKEKRRALIREAANEAVQRADFKIRFGDDAYIAEIIFAAQQKATNIDDPKQIEASRFVLTESGESIQQAAGSDSVPLSELRGLVRDLADMARALRQAADE